MLKRKFLVIFGTAKNPHACKFHEYIYISNVTFLAVDYNNAGKHMAIANEAFEPRSSRNDKHRLHYHRIVWKICDNRVPCIALLFKA